MSEQNPQSGRISERTKKVKKIVTRAALAGLAALAPATGNAKSIPASDSPNMPSAHVGNLLPEQQKHSEILKKLNIPEIAQAPLNRDNRMQHEAADSFTQEKVLEVRETLRAQNDQIKKIYYDATTDLQNSETQESLAEITQQRMENLRWLVDNDSGFLAREALHVFLTYHLPDGGEQIRTIPGVVLEERLKGVGTMHVIASDDDRGREYISYSITPDGDGRAYQIHVSSERQNLLAPLRESDRVEFTGNVVSMDERNKQTENSQRRVLFAEELNPLAPRVMP